MDLLRHGWGGKVQVVLTLSDVCAVVNGGMQGIGPKMMGYIKVEEIEGSIFM